jgi:hypothetical protein
MGGGRGGGDLAKIVQDMTITVRDLTNTPGTHLAGVGLYLGLSLPRVKLKSSKITYSVDLSSYTTFIWPHLSFAAQHSAS